MDAITTDRADLDYSDDPPILIAATSDAAMRARCRTVEASGLRVADSDDDRRRPRSASSSKFRATAIWIELDEDCGGPMDELLGLVSRDVAERPLCRDRVGTGRAARSGHGAKLGDAAVELIVDADDAERAAALAIATQPGRLAAAASTTSRRTRTPIGCAS